MNLFWVRNSWKGIASRNVWQRWGCCLHGRGLMSSCLWSRAQKWALGRTWLRVRLGRLLLCYSLQSEWYYFAVRALYVIHICQLKEMRRENRRLQSNRAPWIWEAYELMISTTWKRGRGFSHGILEVSWDSWWYWTRGLFFKASWYSSCDTLSRWVRIKSSVSVILPLTASFFSRLIYRLRWLFIRIQSHCRIGIPSCEISYTSWYRLRVSRVREKLVELSSVSQAH